MKQYSTNLEMLLKHATLMRNLQAKLSANYLPNDSFSPNELNILIMLSNNITIDTAKELVLYLNVSKGLVCRSLDSLLAKNYICVKEDAKDHRIQRITLNESAKDVIKQIEKARLEMEEALLKGIPDEEIAIIEHAFQVISKNAKEIEEKIL